MARLADGDRSAFTQAFALLWPPTERLCRSLLHDPADAADAAQQAMQKILERAPADYDPERPALPWALALAAWECRTLLRRRQRRREVPEAAGADPATLHPEQELVQRDLGRAALEALGTLSEIDRDALFEAFWDRALEAAPSELPATVRKRRQRALVRLRAAFRRLYGLD
ncbi:MAG: sigma factor [Deltaproteobacteria bacterium]